MIEEKGDDLRANARRFPEGTRWSDKLPCFLEVAMWLEEPLVINDWLRIQACHEKLVRG